MVHVGIVNTKHLLKYIQIPIFTVKVGTLRGVILRGFIMFKRTIYTNYTENTDR